MDLKLRQYEQGKAFCDGVVARAGIEGLNRVWIAPRGDAHGRRAGRPRGLAAPHRAAQLASASEPAFDPHKVGPVYGLFTCSRAA